MEGLLGLGPSSFWLSESTSSSYWMEIPPPAEVKNFLKDMVAKLTLKRPCVARVLIIIIFLYIMSTLATHKNCAVAS